MAYSSTYSSNPFGSMLTKWVRWLLIANCAVFLVGLLLRLTVEIRIEQYLWFLPANALRQPWGLLTYMFVHGDFFHLLMNMLGLFFFGPVLEDRWGSRQFIKFYLLCGLGGALLSLLFWNQAIIGASGAVFGVMVAFAMYWPDSPIYIWGIFPIKAKWLVTGLVALNLVSALDGSPSGTAHLAHLGGAFAAFGYLKSPLAPSAFGEVYGPPSKKRKKKRGWRDLIPRRRSTKLAAEPPAPARPRQPEPRRPLDDVDRILDKISSQGIGSLTAEERRRLEEASRRLGTN
jgi:membrane associated rhomboid family serine protease